MKINRKKLPFDAIAEDIDHLVGQGGDVFGDEVEGDARFDAVAVAVAVAAVGVGWGSGVVVGEGLLLGLPHEGDDLFWRER